MRGTMDEEGHAQPLTGRSWLNRAGQRTITSMDRTFDRVSLGAFLSARRAALQPEDVGLRRGQRRRAPGLRREEVAELCTMSADYFARLERGAGPQPSEQMVAAIARGLRLTLDERDHLFLLAGYRTARR